MTLADRIREIRAAIQSGSFANEAAVKQGAVLPLLADLGWPVFRTAVVAPEYSVASRRVDLALCDPPARPVVFVEVKQAGQTDGADRQLFEYAFHEGVPMAVLTDGQEWSFYLPAEQGRYEDRRVYRLDLVERDVDECERRLLRYLSYDAVRSREAIENARRDYRDVHRRRQIDETLPQAWRKLIEGPEELLIELLSDQVESLCGYRPDPDAVVRFLAERIPLSSSTGLRLPAPPEPPRVRSSLRTHRARAASEIGFEMDGRFVPARSAREVMSNVFAALADRDPTFLDRFAALPRQGRRRRYLARNPGELYPDRPDLARDHSHEFRPGWWLGTNVSIAQIQRIIQMACDVAGLEYGRDLRVKLS